MYVIGLNETKSRVTVHDGSTDPPTLVAGGEVALDIPDRSVLVLLDHLTLTPEEAQQLNRFLGEVASHLHALYQSMIFIRLPCAFDNRIDFDKLQFRNEHPDFMAATIDQLKYYPETSLSDRADQYELITDTELVIKYAAQIRILMSGNAYWATKFNFAAVHDRILSATANAMVLDRVNQQPCAYGRIVVTTAGDETLAYLSQIVVDSAHQSKGLGKAIVNSLVGHVIHPDVRRPNHSYTLSLHCAKEGSGAVSAGRLYRRFGFELIDRLGNRIAIFPQKKSGPPKSEEP